uniref:LRAT domain-containing protein n=1 Tax=Varanus komodoensis TaxID=61221 RepID=A0A8D2J4P3_VARKO
MSRIPFLEKQPHSVRCVFVLGELTTHGPAPMPENLWGEDLIEIFRSCYQHWAIYVGEGKVVHLAPECDHLANGAASVLAVLSDRAYVKKDWLEVVVRKDQFRVNNKHDHTHPPLPLAKILQRAEELVGREMPYNLTSHNCEHFVMELRYGVAMSDQVPRVALASPGGLRVATLSAASVFCPAHL